MVLKVNGEKLDFTLENEKNALDVVNSTVKAVHNEDALVATVLIDGKYYALEDEALAGMKVDEIGEIDIELSSREELSTDLLVECKGMLKNIAADLRQNGYAHTVQFQELFNWISGTIQAIGSVTRMNLAESRLLLSTMKQITDYLNSEEKNEDKIPSLASIVENLVDYIEAIRLKITADFDITGDQLEKEIEKCLTLLPEISSAFQMGKDREALGKINQVISVIELCSFYLQKNLGSFTGEEREEVDEFYKDINSLLNQIVEAFENGDVVLLGDLMEYELPDKLEHYRSLVLEK